MTSKHSDKQTPALPAINDRSSSAASDEFWNQVSPSAYAVRQLQTMARRTRHRAALPGGKLQPLFKNHTAPGRLDGNNQAKLSGKQALPGISNIDGGKGIVHQVMCGNHDNLPDPLTNAVRIYVCSPVTDMFDERSAIREHAYPELKQFCLSKGLDFQLVDLNFGWRDEHPSLNIEQISKLYNHEIAECQNLSLGPSFVALMGEEYVDSLPPIEITQTEYEILNKHLVTNGFSDSAAQLAECYNQTDMNAVPPVRILNVNKYKKVSEYSGLSGILSRAATLATDAGELDATRKMLYSMSETEKQISEGVFKVRDPRSKCLCYVREYGPTNSKSGSTDETETNNNEDLGMTKHQSHLSLLQKLERHLGINNYREYLVKQKDENENAEYLKKLCSDFVSDVKRLIIQNLENLSSQRHLVEPEFQEILLHARLCQAAAQGYEGQEELLKQVERYLHDPRQNVNPLVLHAPQGGGKTATIATLVKLTKTWFTENSVVVVRFLGSTSNSGNVLDLLRSISLQITAAYGMLSPHIHRELGTLLETLTYFRALIQQVSDRYASTTPLFIYLDGLERVFPVDEAARVLWAVKQLPPNVHLIFTVVPIIRDFDILKQVAGLVTQMDCIMLIEELSETSARSLIKQILDSHSRTVDSAQQTIIDQVVAKYKQPIIIKLLAQKMCQLRSGETIDRLADTEKYNLITRLEKDNILEVDLIALENTFGEATLNQILAYIIVSRIGVTEMEMEELIRTNQDVLAALSSSSCILNENQTIPSYVLSHIKLNLLPYLTYQYAYGRMTLSWKHQGLLQSAAARYSVLYPGIDPQLITEDDTENTLEIHDHLAKLYLQKQEEQIKIDSDDKMASAQLWCLLEMLPAHMKVLIPIEGIDKIKKQVLFNLEWLVDMAKTSSIHTLLRVLADVLDMIRHLRREDVLTEKTEMSDVGLLHSCLHEAIHGLTRFPANHLAVELLARLHPDDLQYPFLKDLHSDVLKWVGGGSHDRKGALIPLYPCLPPAGRTLKLNMPGASHTIGICGTSGELLAVFNEKTGVDVWNISLREKVQHLVTGKEQKKEGFLLAESGKFLLSTEYSHINHQNVLTVWSVETGIKLLEQTFPFAFDTVRLSNNDQRLIVGTTMQNIQGSESNNKCFLIVDINTREIQGVIDCGNVHTQGISQVAISSANNFVSVGAGKSKDLAIWKNQELTHKIDLESEAKFLFVHDDKQIAVCLSPTAGILTIVNIFDGKIHLAVEEDSFKKISDAYLSKNGEHVLLATQKEGIIVYSIRSGDVVKVIGKVTDSQENETEVKYKQFPTKIAVDPLELILAVGYKNGEINLYYIPSSGLIHSIQGHAAQVNTLTFYSTINLLSSSDDNNVKQWRLQSLIDQVLGDQFDPVSDSKWNGIRQFEEKTEIEKTDKPDKSKEMTDYPRWNDDITSAMMSHDGQHVITTDGHSVRYWDSKTGKLSMDWDNSSPSVHSLYPAYKGKLLIGYFITNDGTQNLKIMKAETGEVVSINDGMIPVLTSCALPGEDKLLLLANYSSTVATATVIDLFESKIASSIKLPVKFSYGLNMQNISLVATHENEKLIFAVMKYQPKENNSYLYTIRINKENMQIDLVRREPTQIDMISADCVVSVRSLVVIGAINGELVAWSMADQNIKGQFKDKQNKQNGDQSGITCLTISGDCKMMASGSDNGQIRIWDFSSHQMTQCISAHTARVTSLSLSHDGALLASGSLDGSISLWETQDRTCRGSFYCYEEVRQVALGPAAPSVVAVVGNEKKHLIMLARE